MSPTASALAAVGVLFLIVDPVLVTWYWALEGMAWRLWVAWAVTWVSIAASIGWALVGSQGPRR